MSAFAGREEFARELDIFVLTGISPWREAHLFWVSAYTSPILNPFY